MFQLIIGALALLGGVGLAGYATIGRTAVATAGDVEALLPDAPAGVNATGGPSSLHRRMASIAAMLSRPDYRSRMQRRLDLAGNPRSWEPERLLAFRGFGLVGGLLLVVFAGTLERPSEIVHPVAWSSNPG